MLKLILFILSVTICFNAQADKLLLLDSNQDSFTARALLIKNAKQSIRFQYFIMDDDVLTKTQLALLLEAANRGVKVQVIVDSMYNFIRRETIAAMMMELKPGHENNIEIREYNAFSFRHFARNLKIYKRMHDKSLVVDGQYMISGGRNIANGFFGLSDKKDNEVLPVYEDSDALLFNSKAIEQSANYFDDLWNSQFVKTVGLYNYSKKYLDANNCSRIIRHNDRENCYKRNDRRIKRVQKELYILKDHISTFSSIQSDLSHLEQAATTVNNVQYIFDDVKSQDSKLKKPENSIADQLYRVVLEAKESVVIVTPYLVLTPRQEDIFRELTKRNVKVTVITNSKAANDVPSAHVGYSKSKDKILATGIQLYEYQGPDTLHTKMVLVDMSTFYIGTFNWDYRSQNLNREVGLIAELPPEDNEESEDLVEDILTNYAHIMKKSCKVASDEVCTVDHKSNLAEISDDDFNNLMDSNEERAKRKNKLYKILYPILKKQL